MHSKSDVLKKLQNDIDTLNYMLDNDAKKLFEGVLQELKSMPLNQTQIEALMNCEDMLLEIDDTIGKASNNLAQSFVESVYFQARREVLCDRVERELSDYNQQCRLLSPEQLMEKASEIFVKREICRGITNGNLTIRQIDTLLTLERPLETMYQKSETAMKSACEKAAEVSITDTVTERATALLNHQYSGDIQNWIEQYEISEYTSYAEEESEELEP